MQELWLTIVGTALNMGDAHHRLRLLELSTNQHRYPLFRPSQQRAKPYMVAAIHHPRLAAISRCSKDGKRSAGYATAATKLVITTVAIGESTSWKTTDAFLVKFEWSKWSLARWSWGWASWWCRTRLTRCQGMGGHVAYLRAGCTRHGGGCHVGRWGCGKYLGINLAVARLGCRKPILSTWSVVRSELGSACERGFSIVE